MTWEKNAAGGVIGGIVTTGIVYLGTVFLDYGPLVKKEDAEAAKTKMEDSLLELADCVDSPKYEGDSGRAVRDPRCRQRVLDALRQPSR